MLSVSMAHSTLKVFILKVKRNFYSQIKTCSVLLKTISKTILFQKRTVHVRNFLARESFEKGIQNKYFQCERGLSVCRRFSNAAKKGR